MACVRNKSLVSAECIGEDLSANNREYMVLGGSEGKKIISNQKEPKQFKNGKQLTLETASRGRFRWRIATRANAQWVIHGFK